jgi:hypothetical protein
LTDTVGANALDAYKARIMTMLREQGDSIEQD